MSAIGRHTVRGLVSLLLMGVVIVLGQVPMGQPTGRAVVRLALRSTQAKSEVCRDRTAEELEALPIHMREPRVCDVYAPAFRLSMTVDGERLIDRLVEPGGLKGDRPLILTEEVSLPPGEVRLAVNWVPDVEEPPPVLFRKALADLPRFELEEDVELVADRVTLIELDDASDTLRIYGQSTLDARWHPQGE